MSKIVYVDEDSVKFDDGYVLFSEHEHDCCEHHYLSFSDLSLTDFEGMEFDLSSNFFEKVVDFGIRLLPTNGHPISVPGYGSNNGYYSANLALVLQRSGETRKFDITECQEIID